nr:chitobiase/beta-hexosaminidase C-terminal domain-containing protein [Bacteroidota bacterium]
MKISIRNSISIISLLAGLSSGFVSAQNTVPSVFGNNMVFQQNFDAPVWGWAEPGEQVVVTGSWNNTAIETKSNENGEWQIKLPTTAAGGPYFVTINKDTLHNVMLGEVWICSGQSNMQWELEQTENAEEEIRNSDISDIRLFYVARDHADEPSKDCYGNWVECAPEKAKTFSAVAYYFGKELYKELNVPVGLIHVSWGGSSAQAWTNYNVLKTTTEGRYYIEKYHEKIVEADPGINPRNHRTPSGLYNGMLKPLIPFGIRGAIWYQGESNTEEHQLYKALKNTMITSWRDEWGQGDFPFYFVQLAPYEYNKDVIGAALRDQQRKALEIPNTGMAVTLDIGDPEDIHPLNKSEVGKRLSLWALAKTYGKDDLVYSGPLYKSMKVEGDKIRLFFDHIGGGLMSENGELSHFSIAGKERVFHSAKAVIDENTIIVSSKNVRRPVSARYAFENGDEPNLFNKEGLPASTFRTDDWKIITLTPEILSEYDSSTGGFVISMESDEGFEIRYTLDGSNPAIDSEKYTGPFVLFDDAIIKSKIFDDGDPSLFETETRIERHLATGKAVTYINKYNDWYTAGGESGLVNSLFGSTNFMDGHWQGFQGKDMEVIIDLGGRIEVSSITVNCLQVVNSWIILPKQIEIYISDDGKNFTKTAIADHEILVSETDEIIHGLSAQFETIKTNFIKVIAKNYGPLPEWHKGAGDDSWIFVDEIVVK